MTKYTNDQAREIQMSRLESTIIGSIADDPKTWRTVRDIIRPEMFSSQQGAAIAPVMWKYLAEAGVDKWSLSVFMGLLPPDTIQPLQTAKYNAIQERMIEGVESTAARDAAEILAANWQDEQYRATITNLALSGFSSWHDADAKLNETKARIRGTGEHQSTAAVLDEIMDDMWAGLSGKKTYSGISSGFPELDAITGGWHEGQQVVIGGRPGMGKTRFALAQCLTAAKAGFPTVYFTKEMSVREILLVALSYVSGTTKQALKTYDLKNKNEADNLADAKKILQSWPFYVEDRARTVEDLVYFTADFRDRCGMKIFAVDYLQQYRKKSARGQENRNNELSDISSRIKELAMDHKAVALVLSQLSRKVDERPSRRPCMADLRDSGAIEADADIIIFPFRPQQYDPNTDAPCELIMEKHRDGEIGTIEVRWEEPGFYRPTATQPFDPSLNGKLRPAPASDGGPNVITRPGSGNEDDEIPF